jgi:hypothetical protein
MPVPDNDAAVANWEERSRRLLDLLEPAVLTALYVYSVLSWIWGLVFGIVAMAQCKLDANKRVGKICIILAVVNFVLIGCLVAAYILLIIIAVAFYAFLGSSSGGG